MGNSNKQKAQFFSEYSTCTFQPLPRQTAEANNPEIRKNYSMEIKPVARQRADEVTR